MRRRGLLVVAFFLIPGALAAQDGIIADYTPKDFERFVTADLKKTFKVLGDKNGVRDYDIEDTPYFAALNTKEKYALFYRAYPTAQFPGGVTPDQVNAWNKGAIISRVYLIPGGKVQFEGSLDLGAGASPRQVRAFYDRFDAEHGQFLGQLGAAAPAGRVPPPADPVVGPPPEKVVQGFPAAAADPNDPTKSETGWTVEWDLPKGVGGNAGSQVIRIVSATFHFKDGAGKARSLVVARNLMLAEAYSQYDNMRTNFLDVADIGTPMLKADTKYLGPVCVGPGEVLKSAVPDRSEKVYRELHDDGVRWINLDGAVRARRGQKLVLWAVIKAGNYAYPMEYSFTDDGRVVARAGFAAHNFFDRQREPVKLPRPKGQPQFNLSGAADGDVHAHVGCWRFDFDLTDTTNPNAPKGGPAANTIQLVRRQFAGNRPVFRADPFPGDGPNALEGKAKWVATEFTTLRAESGTVKNTRGQPVAYDLISPRAGAATDLRKVNGVDTEFANYDYWVTHAVGPEQPYHLVPQVAGGRQLKGQRTTVWHAIGHLHAPRDEDFNPTGDRWKGSALTEWAGFTLRPRNLFDSTPLFP